MPSHAAQISHQDPTPESSTLAELRTPDSVRCTVFSVTEDDLAHLRKLSRNGRITLSIGLSETVEDVRAGLSDRQVDLVIVGNRDPNAAADLVERLAPDAALRGVPIMLLADRITDRDVAAALRAGATDVLQRDNLRAEVLDQAVESALRRVRGTSADQLALISNLQAENETLRRIAIRNMRLLKGQTMPLMSLAWRMMQGEQIREEDRMRYAKGLARATRNVAGLIDDTVIVAATHHAHEVDADIDLNLVLERILRDDLGDIANSRAHVVVHSLPVLRVRLSQMQMLFEELLLTAVRNGRVGRVPEIEVGSTQDENGNPVIWMVEKGLQLSARKQAMAIQNSLPGAVADGELQDSHAWSMCQRLVERNHGQFRISEHDENSSRLTMRFPRRILIRAPESWG